MITAKVICDSIYKDSRLITLQTTACKYLDAEICKHRMISSNSSSDRAIPFDKMIKRRPFIPTDVRRNQSGMQGTEKLVGSDLVDFQADMLEIYGLTIDILGDWKHVHKQHLNRYLLGFSMQDKVMTANKEQFDYFFGLRLSEHADPAIQELAFRMKEAIDASEPKELQLGAWHLPYVEELYHPSSAKLSVARCARVSYLNHDQTEPDAEKDLALYEQLLNHKHLSCFEHVATPMKNRFDTFDVGTTHIDARGRCWSGNFVNWTQYRQLVANWNEL